MAKSHYLFILFLSVILTMTGAVAGSRIFLARAAQGHDLKAVEVPVTQKWEYRVVEVEGKNVKERAEAVANTLGEQGFEMVNFNVSTEGKYTYQIVFKRPKPQ